MNYVGFLEKENISLSAKRTTSLNQPIGSIYIQQPNKKSPAEHFGFGTWMILNYNGSFFRNVGEKANDFNNISPQQNTMPNLSGYLGILNAVGNYDIPTMSGVFNSSYYGSSTGYGGGSSYDTFYYAYFDNNRTDYPSSNLTNPTANENRPSNYTIKIWKRLS